MFWAITSLTCTKGLKNSSYLQSKRQKFVQVLHFKFSTDLILEKGATGTKWREDSHPILSHLSRERHQLPSDNDQG